MIFVLFSLHTIHMVVCLLPAAVSCTQSALTGRRHIAVPDTHPQLTAVLSVRPENEKTSKAFATFFIFHLILFGFRSIHTHTWNLVLFSYIPRPPNQLSDLACPSPQALPSHVRSICFCHQRDRPSIAIASIMYLGVMLSCGGT
jgi:hypothetical protein